MINAGLLTAKIDLRQPILAKDAIGGATPTYTTIATRRAWVRMAKNKDRAGAADVSAQQQKNMLTMTFRYDSSLSAFDSAWLIDWESNTYKIADFEFKGDSLRTREIEVQAWRNESDA